MKTIALKIEAAKAYIILAAPVVIAIAVIAYNVITFGCHNPIASF